MRERIHVIDNWQAGAIDVFILPPGKESATLEQGQVWRVGSEGRLELQPAGEADKWTGKPTPSFSLPEETFGEVVRAFLKQHPTEGADDAIRDAREVRDRLLALVEETVRSS